MERLLLAFLLAVLLAISVGLIAKPDKDLDGPAPPVTQVLPSDWPSSFHLSYGTRALFADGPAGPVGATPLPDQDEDLDDNPFTT